jgi:hypothetical protein
MRRMTPSLRRFESDDEELVFSLQTPLQADTSGEATLLDDGASGREVAAAIDEAVTGLEREEQGAGGEGAGGRTGSGSNDSTTQDSGNDEKKTKQERKADKERKREEKREKKDKNKDKRKTCEICTTDQEHKEHRKEKKKAKKEKQEKKKEIKKDLPTVPPMPECYDVGPTYKTRMNGDNFFQKLLIKEGLEKNTKMERPSRPTLKKSKELKRPISRASEPALGGYLKGKQAVTDNKFKQFDEFDKFVEQAMLPKGIIKCEEFNEKKSMFERQLEDSPVMARSSSSMSRYARLAGIERPGSAMSNRSTSSDRRSVSLPRPGSSMSKTSESSLILDQVDL